MKAKLYRPQGNNGVRVLMTRDALDAHRAKAAYFDEHNTYNGLDHSIRMRIGFGTFTFTSVAGWLLPGAADRHYGTHDLFNYLIDTFDVETVTDGVYVPFSNGPDGYEGDFADGYGVAKRDLFRWLLAVGQEAYEDYWRNRDDIIDLIESAG